jgi:4'-phosphopantetheinyl transferase
LQRAEWTLSSDERARASRFHFEQHQRHFIAAHGILRTILARYLGREPASLEFCNGPLGKPKLPAGSEAKGLCFNSSHSRGLALYAVTCHCDVGVDVEYIRDGFAWEEVADRFFAPGEVEALRAAPAGSQYQAFFNYWTHKEAVMKASGEGLSLPLRQFEVSLAPGEPTRLLYVDGDSQEASQWSVRELAPAAGYIGAVALRAHGWTPKLWDFPGVTQLTVSNRQ